MWIAVWTKRGEDTPVPDGWHVCDGGLGTPDLHEHFIRGAYNDKLYPSGWTGGNCDNHDHSGTAPAGEHTHQLGAAGGHTHTLVAGGLENIGWSSGSGEVPGSAPDHDHTMSAADHVHDLSAEVNAPPYYTVMYIGYTRNPLHAPNAPVGTIAHWSGASWTIPQGWAICDGTRGTPDLRLKFLRGATVAGDGGDGEDHGDTSVASDHSHTVAAGGAHTHSVIPSSGYGQVTEDYYGQLKRCRSHSHTMSSEGGHSHGLSDPYHDLPLCYCLYFIQKVA